MREQFGDAGIDVLGPLRKDAQRTAVQRELLDPVDEQPMAPEQLVERDQREVAMVLVIDRIEFDMLHQRQQVRHFEHCDAVILQDVTNAANEAIGVLYMRQDVVAVDDVGAAVFLRHLLRQLLGEEGAQRAHADLLRIGGRAIGRVDAEHRNAPLDIVLEQVAVIARQLDHEAVRVQTALVGARHRIGPRMGQQRGREGREIGIVVGVKDFRRDGFEDLHQRAIRAEGDLEREDQFLFASVFGADQMVRQRGAAKVEDRYQRLAPARAAGGFGDGKILTLLQEHRSPPCPVIRQPGTVRRLFRLPRSGVSHALSA